MECIFHLAAVWTCGTRGPIGKHGFVVELDDPEAGLGSIGHPEGKTQQTDTVSSMLGAELHCKYLDRCANRCLEGAGPSG